MNSDVLKRCGQLILVTVDLFSFFVTLCIISSEKAEDLANGIIQSVTPIRRAGNVVVRVDKAPGLVKLANSFNSVLEQAGITLELGDDGNKNSNCAVDKVINELEEELRKLSPSADKINLGDLAQVSISLNRKIRNRGFSAEEIHFSRDSFTNKNLALCDKDLSDKQLSLKLDNHERLANSRTPNCQAPTIPRPNAGDIVFIKSGDTKHTTRDPHLVLKSEGHKSLVRKTLHFLPTDGRPLNFSSRPKQIDNKFLFKPHSYNNNKTRVEEDISPCQSLLGPPELVKEEPLSSVHTVYEQGWIPTSQEAEELFLMTEEHTNDQELHEEHDGTR